MPPLTPHLLAELHREAYVAILHSWVPHGQRGEYARRAGISREYLSNLTALDPTGELSYPQLKLPSERAARRLAAVLPAPAEFRESLFEHMQLAHAHRHAGHRQMHQLIADRRVPELLAGLRAEHGLATFGKDLRQTEQAYRALRAHAQDALVHLSPGTQPAAYAQACLYLHDAQCVLDRAGDALYYARLGRLVLEESDAYEPEFTRPEIDDLYINTIRGEGVAYHNLGLEYQVPRRCDQAQLTPAYRNAGTFWQPLVGRDRLNALASTPRFGRREARSLAHALMAGCEQTGDGFTLFLVRESWLRCLIRAERWTEAQRLLAAEFDLLPQVPYSGPLHRALLLKTAAHLAWERGDRTGWHEHARGFVVLARAAGLKHQLREFERLYGAALTPLTDDLEVKTGPAAG